MAATQLICYCQGACPDHQLNGTCLTQVGGYCYAAITEVHDVVANRFEPEWTYGCLPPDETGYMQCQGDLSPHQIQRSIKCCYNEDLCNQGLQPRYTQTIIPPKTGFFDTFGERQTLLVCAGVVGMLAIVLFVLLVVLLWKRYKENHSGSSQGSIMSIEKNGADLDDSRTGSSSNYYSRYDCEMTSGSGSGAPLLIKRSLAKDIDLIECIGRGRYGECWRARWMDEDVAVKRIVSHEEKSWKRETEIYNTPMMRHDNILAYLASDVISVQSCTQFWLVSQYHPMGSLYDFLCIRAIPARQALQILSSAMSGLLHLHTEMRGTTGKPAIAHRDLKAKNILLKSPTVACICDFGLAISHKSTSDLKDDIDLRIEQVGTKRYMAPEILDRKLDLKMNNAIEHLKCADIYSIALVMWETLCRSFVDDAKTDKEAADECLQKGPQVIMGYNDDYKAPLYDEYKVPYYDVVPSNPSFADMRKVVVVDQYRPRFPPRFSSNETLAQVAELIRECWNHNPAARLPALRIKKTLNKLLREAQSY